MKITILDKIAMGEDTPFQILDTFGEVIEYSNTQPDETLLHIGDSEVIIVNKVKIDYNHMNSAKNLKLICVFATGYDNIDINAAKKLGIAVCNVSGYSTDSVALFTAATVLSLISHLGEYNRFVRSGLYTNSGVVNRITPVFHELRGMTWGIVGAGNIGTAVMKIAEAFGANVIVNKRTPNDKYNCVDIDTLCRESDIITLHCPLNDSTRKLIGKERISVMKNGVILVNEARGDVLNERDVTDAVKSGKIAAFGCDVYSTEPFSEDHPYNEIKDYDNVILTPHTAWGSYEARVRCIRTVAENIKSYLSGDVLNRVDL